jgi:rhamnosyl/mannosyltransferase
MKCSAFVFPSNAESEAFGLVQLEAMAAGKPVINTRLKTGVPEVSIDGETGITVNPNAPHELAEAMRKLHENPELRQRLGQNARERVKQHFVHSVTIPKIETIYQNLVA